jgi:hypothetical protein
MSITNSRKIKLGAAAAVLMGLAFAAQAAVLTWDAGNADDRIDRTTNWNPDGVPTVGVNNGVVTGSYVTTYYANQSSGYEIAWNNTSSLTGTTSTAGLGVQNGAIFTFNDSSKLTVGGALYIGGQADTTTGALTLNNDATATVASTLSFALGGATGTAGSGSLTLRGNSSLTTSSNMYWQKKAAQASLTHYLTLADSSALTVNNAEVKAINSAVLVVNFEQADNRYTPTWTLGEAVDFNQATIQYQINGTNTTFADSRFVKNGTTLSLTVIPEPATIGMLGLGALVTLLIRRMSTR